MKGEIKIPYKLHSHNEFKVVTAYEFLNEAEAGKMNNIRAKKLQNAQLVNLTYMMQSRQWDALRAILSHPTIFSIEYHQNQPYDEAEAIGGAEKTIIDPLRKRLLIDDKPVQIKTGSVTFIKCEMGKEYILAIFETVKDIKR